MKKSLEKEISSLQTNITNSQNPKIERIRKQQELYGEFME